jgi:hypothetical protein
VEGAVVKKTMSLLLRNRSGVRNSVWRPVIMTDIFHGLCQSLQTNFHDVIPPTRHTVFVHILPNSLLLSAPLSGLLATPLN